MVIPSMKNLERSNLRLPSLVMSRRGRPKANKRKKSFRESKLYAKMSIIQRRKKRKRRRKNTKEGNGTGPTTKKKKNTKKNRKGKNK